ncbi:FHA domain-containing protein [Undibacterium luofuense]|uniref:FHA domain-containing protein n=1 Tax=Undibacterium luofuense TaxID=2828733 RepID=UPI0030EC87B4
MAKIIVTFNGLVQQEYGITKSRVTVGRRPGNDLVIDHLTVSGQHAAIDTTSSGSFVLDLGSTNGTMVNNQPVKKHLLQHGDVIDIGKYKLRFQQDASAQTQAIPANTHHALTGKIKVLNGPNAGKELALTKPLTTIGSPATLVMAISKQADQYFLRHVEGRDAPKLNGVQVGSDPVQLKGGDIIEMLSVQMQFFLA